MPSYKDITYTLTTSDRKTLSIYIERDGQISVLAPQDFTSQQLDEVLEQKRGWIYKGLAEWEDLNATRFKREYVNGEGFLYLGRNYRLQIVVTQDKPLQLKNGYFNLSSQSLPKAEDVFKEFYRQKGNVKLRERVSYYQNKLGVKAHDVRVLELKNRWASCSEKGNLNFHWKCMMAPLTVLDYVVVHELVHLLHKNHTTAFWNEIDKLIPDYQERKQWLKVNGAGMGL
jgi:predicted metal-dependent hydrolase